MRAKQKIPTKRKTQQKQVRAPVLIAQKAIFESLTDEPVTVRRFSAFSRLAAMLLFSIFLLQPISTVFAAEEPVATPAEAPAPEIAQVEMDPTSVAVEDGPAEEAATPSVATPTEPVETAETPVPATASEGGAIGSTIASTTEPISGGVATSTEGVPNGSSSETATSTEVSTDETSAVATTTEPEVIPEILPPDTESPEEVLGTTTEEIATSTEVTVEMPEVQIVTNDDNRYQFGIDECVTVEDGFFYCTKDEGDQKPAEDRVYAAQDDDGDFEIFISKDGVDTQITHNTYDDNAPYYDPESDRLVWHTLVNDRYQIMLYDFADGEMTQLTNEAYNNMEPVVLGNRIVWQAWIDNNWEIILDEDGERTQLTENETHDIDPHLRGDLVSWQALVDGAWSIKVYNTKTGDIDVIEGTEGASAANPRFVLVYDSLNANGDIETVGYDLEEGVSVPLSAIPRSVPKDIPEPEHEKEARALIQTPPSVKDKIEGDIDDTPLPQTPLPDLGIGTSTATSTIDAAPGDIVIPSASTTPEVLPQDPPQIPPVDMSTSSATATIDASLTAHIPDIVIPAPEPEVPGST